MEGNRHFVFAFLCALFAVGFSDPMEYDLQQYCNTTIDTFSAALLNIKGFWWAGTKECTVRIHATHSYDNQVRLEILKLKTPCQSLWITLQDGPDSQDYSPRPTQRPMSPMLCDDGRNLQTMYLTTSDVLTVTITVNSTAPLDPDDDLDVQLIATSTSSAYQYGDFECDNMFDVIDELECDGYNNCGDGSDESHHHCHHHWGWRVRVGVITGSCVVGVLIVVVVVVIIVRRRRRRSFSSKRESTKQTIARDGPPPYGSLQ